MAYNEDNKFLDLGTFRDELIKLANTPNKDFTDLVDDVKKECIEHAKKQEFDFWFHPKNSTQQKLIKTENFSKFIRNELKLDMEITENSDYEMSVNFRWDENKNVKKRRMN